MASDLTLDHISKSYLQESTGLPRTILKDISLQVEKGSFVTILGGNGSGKSTLMRIITGMEHEDSGRILIDGQEGKRLGRVGMVSQEINLFPWLTALENVAFGLEMQKMPKAKRLEIATAYLHAFGLGEHLHQYPRELSGGMRQKVAIARTLVAAPDITLMDEPFSALDYQTRTGLQCFFLQLWAKLRETVLFVTHEVEEAIFLSDYIVIISPIPATVTAVIPVPMPRPRVRTSPDFVRTASEVFKLYGARSCLDNQELRHALSILAQHKAERHSAGQRESA